MLELFFNASGIVHMEFIPGVTLNKHRYKEILRRLRNTIHRKHPELCRRKNWLLLYDNACTSLCACPRGAGKTTGHRFATPSILT
jgi:hypothetical protein